MILLNEEAVTFDDVTMVPNYSAIKSRKEPSVENDFSYDIRDGFVSIGFKLNIPIIASPMNTVCEHQMAKTMLGIGGDGVIHRYMSIEKQLEQVLSCKLYSNSSDMPFFAIGATGDYFERAVELYKAGINKFCIDVANGDSEVSVQAVEKIKKSFDCILMAGNVCTVDGYMRLAARGADMIRVGIGSGAMCKTRVVSGHGVPQLTALMWAAQAKKNYPRSIIVSDGGIRNSGDMVKALAIADCVMLGSLLAGTTEAPGQVIKEDGEEYKLYAGMASETGRSLSSWFDRDKTAYVPEGESIRLKCKGSVVNVVNDLISSVKVGMSYAGALNLKELKEKSVFIRVTNNGSVEGQPQMHREKK
jgi:IMP dehydrogenase